MLTDKQIADALALIDERYHKVIQKYLKMVGRTVLKIGELNQSSINLLIQLRRMGVDVQTIEKELRNATRLTQSDIRKLYKKAAEEANTDARFEYITKGVEPDNNRWNELVESIWRQTAGTMENLSNTTSISEEYKEVISEAVQAVSMGATDYKAAIRDSIKRLGGSGIRVEYESGYKRRLDTAVRQNVLDGVRQIQLESQKLIGEEIGADGVEITAHPNSAPDHEPVQGRQFDIENFERMQSAQPFEDADGNWYKPFERPIREWNCRHFVHYIILGVSKRMYSDEQLEEWKKENREGCDINGKHYTKYEATQLMRKIETAIRKQKDTAVLAQASGDDVLRRECQSNITQLTSKYDQVAKAAGLRARPEKTIVKEFKPVKLSVFENPPGNLQDLSAAIGKELDNYCTAKSKWSGTTHVMSREQMPNSNGRKEWNCDISVRSNAEIKTVVHEHLHARSVSYYPQEVYLQNQNAEEASVELYAQEICKKNRIKFKPAYADKVKQLDIINNILRYSDRYDFARDLFDIPLPQRYNWLRKQADELISSGKLSHKTINSLNAAVEFFSIRL